MSMAPLSMADLVSGPPTSRDLNALKVSPYVSFRPGWQNGLVGHSGGPPRVIWLATELRSDIFLRLFLSAVALVTAKAFWSAAGEYCRAVSLCFCTSVLSLSYVALASPVAPASLFRKVRRLPMY